MSDLIQRIQAAQRNAGEAAVIADLEAKGLVKPRGLIPIEEHNRLTTEIERLRDALKTAQYRSMVDARISYRGYSYGMRSMSGIADLRRAIERDGKA